MANAVLKGNRKWTVDAAGNIVSLTRRYQIIRSADPLGTSADEIASATGLPALQSAHSTDYPNLICSGYSFEEGEANGRRVLLVDVAYTANSSMFEANMPPRGQSVEQIGWRSGSVARDLVADAKTGKLVVSSAGQPFDSVPQIDVPSPTFTKVVKFASRKSGWFGYQGKVNSSAITVCGVSCGVHCLRCVQVDEERLWNDDFGFKYRYTISLQLMHNMAKIEGAENATDIGWDMAVVDCGTMQLDDNSEPKPIKVVSEETGKEVYVSNPVLLDGEGNAKLESNAEPYAFKVQAYDETTFPADFYSEPD